MTDIKYLLKFGKREHLQDLTDGNLYCSNATTFWGIEDKLKMILSRLVDTFSSRILYPMRLPSGNYSIAVV